MDRVQKVSDKLNNIVIEESTPEWAKVLIGCVTELSEAVKSFHLLNDRVSKLEDVNKVRDQVIHSLQSENANLKKSVSELRAKTDENEQKSRTQCLLIHGVLESDRENTDDICINIIKNQVGVAITIDNIEHSHRLGPRKNPRSNERPKPRAIIMRFLNMRKRIEVYRNKSKLKGKRILITENLTKLRYNLFQEVKVTRMCRQTMAKYLQNMAAN